MPEEHVVLVNEADEPVGTCEKLRAHTEGLLHRAVSVLVFDRHGRLLLQQRNPAKYHSGGLWSNTCCTHPRPGEVPAEAALRRLDEEMGLSCRLTHAFTFQYAARVGPLTECEVDHVFVGTCATRPAPDPAEVSDWTWVAPARLLHDLGRQAGRYTAWLPLLLHHARALDADPARRHVPLLAHWDG
jgi:isopentenyl-diphosphate Delta-isomerase